MAIREELLEEVRRRFPRTAAAFAEQASASASPSALSQVVELEQRFVRRRRLPTLSAAAESAARSGGVEAFDVVLMGGGLSLIFAVTLAQAGLRVCVFDQRRIGCGHREWNISRRELWPLVDAGLYSAEEAAALVLLEYRTGFCRFAGSRSDGQDGPGSGTYSVDGVLDCVVNAEALLAGLRERALGAGVTLLDYHQLEGYRIDSTAATIALSETRGGGGRLLEAQLLVDGLGASSPHALFDLCCPTVGGVMEGLKLGAGQLEMDPEVGEILVTTEGVEDGQQHIWEGFPAPPGPSASEPPSGRMTIYLFYYQRAEAVATAVEEGRHPLLGLYERFFATLPRYKLSASGEPLRMLRPTYGYIPAYTRLGPMPTAPSARVLLVGDAAARHSPLTFCGFGSMIRSFLPISRAIVRCLREQRLSRRDLDAVWQGLDPPALQVMGGLTLMMMPPPGGTLEDPDGINDLLNAAFASLFDLGPAAYASFLHDAVGASTFIRFMRTAAGRYPAVYRKVLQHMTPMEAVTWVARLARFRAASSRPPARERAVARRASGDNTGT